MTDSCIELDCITPAQVKRFGCLKWLVLGIMFSTLMLVYFDDLFTPKTSIVANGETSLINGSPLAIAPIEVGMFSPAGTAGMLTGNITLQGQGESGAIVEILHGEDVVGEVPIDNAGNWSFAASVTLAPGDYNLSTRMVDDAGNILGKSDPILLSVPNAGIEAVAADASYPGTSDSAASSENNSYPATDQDGNGSNIDNNDNPAYPGSGDEDNVLDTPSDEVPEDGTNSDAAPSLAAPTMALAVTETIHNAIVLNGKAAPQQIVNILLDNEVVDTFIVGEEGTWRFSRQLSPGDHTLVARTITENGDILDSTPQFLMVAEADLIAAAEVEGNLKGFIDAAQVSSLTDALHGEEPFTVFAPTDDIFQNLPRGIIESLGENPAALRDLLLGHMVAGIYTLTDLSLGDTLETSAGSTLVVGPSETHAGLSINDAPIISGDVQASNGVIHSIDGLLLPPVEAARPIIDASGVPVFSGDFLTVVGNGEPGTILLLALNGSHFGSTVVDGNGNWQVADNIKPGDYTIVAYTLDSAGILRNVSNPVYLSVSGE